MIETSPLLVLLWWALLLASIVLILREMIRWLKRRTADLREWVDAPRVKPPSDEVTAMTTLFDSLSKNSRGQLKIGQIISDAVIDRVGLTLQMDQVQLKTLSGDKELAMKTFGEHAGITNYFSEKWIVKTFSSNAKRKQTRKSDMGSACLKEITHLFGEIDGWEKEYESSRGI